jgi:hypothetical protein
LKTKEVRHMRRFVKAIFPKRSLEPCCARKVCRHGQKIERQDTHVKALRGKLLKMILGKRVTEYIQLCT